MTILTERQQSIRDDNFLGIGIFSFVALLVYSFIFGSRYNVGVDYPRYLSAYEDLKNYKFSYDRFEYLFLLISKFFAYFKLHFSFYFGVLAFAQIYFLFLAVRKERFVYPFLVFSIMIGTFWLSYMNGIRQILAFCIFAFSIDFLLKKKWIQYFLIVIVASLIHRSALILVPVYLIFNYKNEFFKNISLQLFMLGICLILMIVNIRDRLLVVFEQVAIVISYNKYAEALNEGTLLIESLSRERGVGFFVTLGLNIFLILLSNRVKKFYDNKKLNVFYDLYFIGVLWFYLVNGSLILNRPNYYFYSFQVFIISFSLFYIFKTQNFIFKLFAIFWIGLLFLATMYRMEENTAYFSFFWNN